MKNFLYGRLMPVRRSGYDHLTYVLIRSESVQNKQFHLCARASKVLHWATCGAPAYDRSRPWTKRSLR